jgi:DNA-directed RNA polymerase specialized sigma24 family protein
MTDSQASSEQFNSEVSNVLPRLKKYVANRLRLAVIDGIIGPGKYRPEDITDEVFIPLKQEYDKGNLPLEKVKIAMFRLADRELARILAEEGGHAGDISIEDILAGEMRELEEKYSVDADGDLVMYEEFDDISYQHDREQRTVYLLEPGFENDLIETLDLAESCAGATAEARNLLARVYQRLPTLTSAIIDLHVAGGLSTAEIAEVRELQVQDVEKVIRQVRVRFTTVLTGAS